MLKISVMSSCFKDHLTADKVCYAIKRGLKSSLRDASISIFPMADGGQGTSKIISKLFGGKVYKTRVHDPLMRLIDAHFYFNLRNKTGAFDMCVASGLHLLKKSERNPTRTTTYGVGELIKSLIERGAKKIYVGLGDSATNDGGVGMAQPLGFKFYDKLGRELPIGRFSIEKIHYIKFPNLDKKVKFIGLCDGNYTLCGKEGISKISVLNKGGKLSDARKLENEMRHLNKLFKIYFGKDFSKIKKSGCAGGLAAGLSAFLDAKLVLGAKFIIDKFHLRKIIKNQDLIIVGEGEINFQTVNGKAVYIISKMAKRYGIPVVAFTGRLGKGFSKLYNYGVKKILVTDPQQIPFEQVKKKGLGVKYIENKARELGQELNKVV